MKLFKFLKSCLRCGYESVSSQRRTINGTQRHEVTKIYQAENFSWDGKTQS